jgi:alanine-synthesizing transaminase
MEGFSSRSRFAADPNRLTAAVAAARSNESRLLDLTESNPTRVGLSPRGRELLPLLSNPHVASYEPEPFGLLAAREAICAELAQRGYVVPATRVLLSASTSEAYSYLFKLLCDPGDSVLVPAPSYPLLDVLAQLEQVRLLPYRLQYDGEWHLDRAALSEADERTRAIVVVHPNNPTGSYLKRSELAALSELGLPIISDEVFADYALSEDPERAHSALEASDQALVFRLSGLSKASALPQLKLAWMAFAGPDARVEEARDRLEHIADAYLSPGAQVQLALPQLLAASAATRERIRGRVRDNLALLERALFETAASVLRVEGGWYAIVRLPNLHDDESWALTLLERDGVLTQPGYYYDLQGGPQLVVSLIVENEVMRAAAAKMANRVRAISG